VHQLAAQWIVELLGDRNIPFLICGGLAAKGYGSERDLNPESVRPPPGSTSNPLTCMAI